MQFQFTTFWTNGFRGWFFNDLGTSQSLLNNAWSNVTNVPAEPVETCWRENWAVVIFGLVYVFFRTLSISILMCVWLNIYFTTPIKTADNRCNYSPDTRLSTRWYNMTRRRMLDPVCFVRTLACYCKARAFKRAENTQRRGRVALYDSGRRLFVSPCEEMTTLLCFNSHTWCLLFSI